MISTSVSDVDTTRMTETLRHLNYMLSVATLPSQISSLKNQIMCLEIELVNRMMKR